MQNCVHRVLPALLIAGSAALWAAPACLAEMEASEDIAVRLLSPRNGATLVAGSTAELEWTPLEAFADLDEVEEWEAFLSVDAGKTYPMRITPHLDQDVRRIRWQVPSFPTKDARLLLRFGDEREETSVELPVQFSIEAPETALPTWESTLQLAHWAEEPGESALPGQPGVVAWIEGSRRGESARQVVAAGSTSSMRERFDPSSAPGELAEVASTTRPPGSPARIASKAAGSAFPAARPASLARAGAAPSLSSDILLLTQRQNE